MIGDNPKDRKFMEKLEALAGLRKSDGGRALTESALNAVNERIAAANKALTAAERQLASVTADLTQAKSDLAALGSINPSDFAKAKHEHQIADVKELPDALAALTTGLNGVVSSGSGANGKWVRFATGVQMCWHQVSVSLAIATAHLGGFRSFAQTWTFPQAFSDVPSASVYALQATAFGAISTGTPSTTSMPWSVTAVTSQATASTRTVSLIAIGSWTP